MCNLLEKHNQGERLFDNVKAFFESGGMAMKQDTILDATLNAVVNSTKFKHSQGYPRFH
jgi:IS5 family transposase